MDTAKTHPPSDIASQKYRELLSTLEEMGSVIVAFSGGVDSALVLKAAVDALGDRALAVTGLSSTYAPEEMDDARTIAGEIGADHIVVSTMELTDPRYANNTHQRCFFCKTELYGRLNEVAREKGFDYVVDGANADDVGDFRPGMRAAERLGIRSPLLDVGLTKSEIRELSHWLDLPTWDKPAAACLASRFAYGDPITVEKLSQVATAESFLRSLGYRGFRVRHEGDTARLEFPPEQLEEVFARRSEIAKGIKSAGYHFVSLDLDGYRSGSLNEVLNARLKPQ